VSVAAAVPSNAAPTSGPILAIEALCKSFGGVRAVDGVSFSVATGEVVALIGPNGAGKTTLLNLVSGQSRPDAGRVVFAGREVTRLPASAAGRRGMLRAFQDGGVFAKLTAVENVMVPAVARGMAPRHAEPAARAALDRLGLTPIADERAERVSGGQRKLIDFARCLLTDARVVLLDEPTTGVHPSVARSLAAIIAERRRAGTAFVLVSHDLPWAFAMCTRAVVMVAGEKLMEDLPAVVGRDPRVHEAYL
jgi:ABC-type branched-subunit amino acid transport system ATPase component